ncbi:MAG: fasciclin domain-containing protein [Alteraurantiacibacter sp.]
MYTTRLKGGALAACASLGLLAIAACSEADVVANEETAEVEPGSESIASLIAGADDLSQVESLVEAAGLSGTFDGTPNYTIFAPKDAAFEAMGEDFTGEEAQPALIAVLREHVVPGYLTPEDIANAVEANGGTIEMQTMGQGMLTFAMDGDALTVATTSGAPSRVDGALLGSNGVVIPVDAVLKDLAADE